MTKLIRYGFLHSLGVLIYVIFVANFMSRAENWFGQMNGALGAAAFLLLFVFSATFVAGLVLGKPVLMYLEGNKKNALTLLFYTVGWLFVWLILFFVILVFI
ncbi:MAG TPA: hypothetical protein PLH37_03200 [bacterium]|nr:hypothetical protein [bacterium]